MSPRPQPSSDAPFDAALALARAGRFDEALAALRRAAGAGSRHADAALAFAELARTAEESGAARHALEALDAATALAPGYADLHYRRGCALITAQRHADARAAFDRALAINPRYAAARLERALLDARDGRLAEALAALRALDEERRVEEPAAFQRGLKSLERADWEEAGALLKSALRLSDPVLDSLIARHQALIGQGEHVEARRALREAVTAHPEYPDLHYLLGCCELESGFIDDAIASFARALELHPDYHAARVQFARALEAIGDLAQAGDQVALVLDADPAHGQALELEQRWSRRRTPAAPQQGPRKRP